MGSNRGTASNEIISITIRQSCTYGREVRLEKSTVNVSDTFICVPPMALSIRTAMAILKESLEKNA